MDAVEIDRGSLVTDEADLEPWLDEQGRFTPHAETPDGVSPRALPGAVNGAHMTTGLEHDELGRRTEDTEVRKRQVEKRARKMETATEREDWSPREFGDPDADTLVVSWGSNEGAMLEAMDFLDEPVRFLSVPYVHPRPDLTDAVEAAENVVVVECNSTGQFADLVEHDTLTRVDRLTKYDGVRFKADELAAEIEVALAGDGGGSQEVKA